MYGADAYTPQEVSRRIEEAGVAKVRIPWPSTAVLGVLGGGFVGLGCLFFLALWAPGAGAPAALLAGVAFSMGYFLAVTAGAEVFTSNNLVVMAWAGRRIRLTELLRNWGLVLGANAVGAVGLACVVAWAAVPAAGGWEAGTVAVAAQKAQLGSGEAFLRGVLGNLLVCLAYWAAMAGRSVADRFLGTVLPLSAVAVLNLEHAAASLFFLPLGFLLDPVAVPASGLLRNLVPVVLGNVVGGAVMVALVYRLAYGRLPAGDA